MKRCRHAAALSLAIAGFVAVETSVGQTTPIAPANPAVSLGQPRLHPISDVGAAATSVRTPQMLETPGRIEHIARQYDDSLPPPDVDGEVPPLPRLDALPDVDHLSSAPPPHPFAFDYVFIGRAAVQDGEGSILMSEVGGNYMHRAPISEKFLLTVRPFAGVVFLSGPVGDDPVLPAQVYRVGVDLQSDFRFNETWGISWGISPGLWTDFNVLSIEDVRLPSRLMATYRASDSFFLAAGLYYTDNIRRNLFPYVGFVWDVNDRIKLEMMAPRLRAIYSLHQDLQFYAVFEFYGQTYSIRSFGEDDKWDYRDLRLMIGTDVGLWSRASFFGEVGIAFYRRMVFEIQEPHQLDAALIVRAGARF